MKDHLKTYLLLLFSLICPFTLSAQTPLDSVAVDSILSARYPRIYPVYLDSAQIASLVDEMSSVPELYSVEYEETPISVTLDNTKAVGFIPVKSEVSPTGAKLYEIPIDVYPGMNGMTPSISLSYNSHSGRGLAGVGWSVSGISSIRRSQKTVEHNGYADGVQLNTDDSFVLDGTRLVYSSKESGYILYVSEQGNIKAKGYYSGDITTHFDVYYPDGKKGVYGSSLSTDNNLVYPLMSMSDIKGNTISYTYIQTENNYTLSEISYNGASVLFQYESDRPDPIGTYLGGLGMNESNLLKSIVCKFGDTVLGTYSLTHITQNRLSLLSQVDYTAGTESFNPVRFFYNNTVSNRTVFSNTNTILSGYYPFDERVDLNVVRGKFNYDVGDEGLAVYPNYHTYIKVLGLTGDYNDIKYTYFRNYYEGNEKIFIYSGIGKNITQAGQEITTEAGFVDLLTADLDGNQQEYLIKVNNRVVNGQEELTFKAYKVGIFPTPLEVYNKSFTLSTVYNGGDIEFSVQPKFYRVGDFNGDGKQEIMAVSAHEPFGDTSLPSKVYVFDIVNGNILYEKHVFDYNVEFLWAHSDSDDAVTAELNTDKLFVLDYDGDGKTDVCHINGSWMTMYSFDTSGSSMTMKQEVGTTTITNSTLQNRELLFGEFNGDGLVDMLLSPTKGSSSSAYWTIYNSKGDGQFVANRFSGVSYEDDDDDDVGFITQDVNGDGISDVIKYTNIGFYVYFVNGNKFGVVNGYYAFSKEKAIMLSTEVNTHNVFTQVVAFKDSYATCYSGNYDYNRESLIGGMANSLGVVERNTYRKIDASSIESGFYTKGTGAEFPYVNIVEPINMLTTTETYVNSSLAEEVNYTYQNAVMNRQGLGFCGFETVTSTDNHGRTRVRTYDPMKYGIPTKEETAEYKTTYNYTAVRNDDGTLKIRLDSKIEEDLLKGTSTPTMISYDDYGNATYISTYYPNSISKNSTNKYSNTTTATDGYYIGFLYDQVNKTHKKGNTVLEHINIPAFSSGYPNVKISDIDGNQVKIEVSQYDSHGNLTTKTITPYSSTVSQAMTYEYDSYGRLVKETDPLGLSKEYIFDETGRVSCTKDIRGNSTSYAYDSFGRDTLTVYPDGIQKTVKYAWSTDRDGELYSITTSETGQPTETVYYDALNREVRRKTFRFDDSVIYVDKVYNSKGKVEKESLPYKTGSASLWNVYTYDEHDRVIACTEASGRTTTYTYNGTKVTTVEDGVSVTRDYDSQGDLISVEDSAGTVTYDLCPDGKPSSITAPGDVTVTFGYDKYRRRISIDDPSHGLTTYEYDAAGNVSKEVTARGDSTIYHYDNFNRPTETIHPEMTTWYHYNQYDELLYTNSSNGTAQHFTYDDFGRIIQQADVYTESGNTTFLERTYAYSQGNLSRIIYRTDLGDLATTNHTYANGYLRDIVYYNNTPISVLRLENEFGQPTLIGTIAGARQYGYNQYGLPTTRISRNKTGGIIKNELYDFNPLTGNLMCRTNLLINQEESFSYDNLNRLIAGSFGENITYDTKGNIIEKTGIGTFGYNHTSKPYAITDVALTGTAIPQLTQEIEYTSFRRPSNISEGDYHSHFTYNSDFDRVKMHVTRNGVDSLRRYYLGGCYERDVDSLSNVTERLYLGGDYYSAPAVLIKTDSIECLHFIHCDYLGNITHITDDSGVVEQELSYDAWGRLRNPETHEVYAPGTEPELMLGRGYTGHEHLPWFGLINMNARLYDPVLGRFLSPDPFVQAPDLSQNFNRYAYAMNNPFRYTDETGEFFWLVGALIGGVANVVSKAISGDLHNLGDGLAAFGIGAVAGAVGGVTGAWAFGIAGGAAAGAGGFLAGAASGAVSNALSMPVENLLNHWCFGDPLMSLGEYVGGVFSSALLSGSINGISAKINGKNFWTGKELKPSPQPAVPQPTENTPKTTTPAEQPTTQESMESIRESIVGDTKMQERNYSLYVGFDEDDVTVRYVGITKRDPNIRIAEHLGSNTERAGLSYIIEMKDLTKIEARIWEQRYINMFGLKSQGGYLYNKINSINQRYWNDLNIIKFDIK